MENTELVTLKGIGEKTAKLFEKVGVFDTDSLLTYYPKDYDLFEPIKKISEITANETAAIRAMVMGTIVTKKNRNLSISTLSVRDETGELSLIFFNMPYLKSVLPQNGFLVFRGLVTIKNQRKCIEQPKLYKEDDYDKLLDTLQPRYALTKGLTNNMITKAVTQSLSFAEELEDYLPNDLRIAQNLITKKEAILGIHFPKMKEDMLLARRRLVFDEFFLFLLQVRRLKERTNECKSENIMLEAKECIQLLELLPYSLTNAQKRVWNEIKTDLEGDTVMNRLVQGDVGSGKTIIAFLALLTCAANGYQGALMAPTEVLAKQHFDALSELSEKYHLPISPTLLVGSLRAKEKKEKYCFIANGEINIIIGTHALIQEKVVYQNLALVVTDEQHRFGVRQRESLAGKGEKVHVLAMSATPIPRTLAIILYGDLNISIIDELPANRLPIKNCVVDTAYRKKAYQFIEKEVREKHQVYIICPMVEEGELEGVENVSEYTNTLKDTLPSSIRIASLHGKMKPSLKNQIMEEFLLGDIDVLVSTTVIEVGINVPNASIMMVENAERFGLAQLHQLRGRIGRGTAQSYCIFVSGNDKKKTLERLKILNQSNDGFFIAEEDLKLRGPGDLFGIRQSGDMEFLIGDIYNDSTVLKEVAIIVEAILKKDKNLEQHESIRKYLEKQRIMIDFRSI